MAEKKIYGMLAEFDSAQSIYQACEAVRDEGFKHWDAHVPFPVHGLEHAMGLRPSKIPWIVLGGGLFGTAAGFTLAWWSMVVEYPTVIAGKPFFAWPAFIPVTFEMGVLFGAFGALLGMLGLNKLPMFHHPLFNSERFQGATDDRFFISVEARDPLFDKRATKKLLKKLGATHIEEVMEA